jgi:hypothetical protein
VNPTAVTTPAPSPSTASLLPLRPARTPRITLPHPGIVATLVGMARAGYPTTNVVASCDPDCDECLDTGRAVSGVYGGKVCFTKSCPECGRESERE